MNRQELNALLETLHAELAAGPKVDDALKHSLQVLEQDIQRVMRQASAEAASDEATDDAPDDGEPDINALAQALEAKLEAGHPYLVSTLRDLMDRLGKMGI